MTKTFKQLQEDVGKYAKDLIDPASLNNIRKWALQTSHAYQPDPKDYIVKLETELNKFGFSIGLVNLEDFQEDSGEVDLFLYTYASDEVVKNAYVNVCWNKLSSGQQYDLRPDGAKLSYEIELNVIELNSNDIADMIGAATDQDENDHLEH